jgi:hypothetical protein
MVRSSNRATGARIVILRLAIEFALVADIEGDLEFLK